jgi:GntR family histidine utilization transcriptional repressor
MQPLRPSIWSHDPNENASGKTGAVQIIEDVHRNRNASLAQQLPQYQLIRNALVSRIRSGALKPGDRVESENELGIRYGVSRLTVQRAIRELVSEGMLRRVQGSGTFVSTAARGFPLIEVRDLVEEIRSRGGSPHTEVLVQRRIVPNAPDRALMELAEGAAVFHATLLISSDGLPVALEDRQALPDVYPDFLDQDFTTTSIFTYFASRSVLEDIENVVRAVLPDRRIAQLLEIGDHEPCILVERRNWFRGRCVTLTRVTYAGTRQVLGSRYRPQDTH